jgi:type II secretory pathway component GspD/PulD (secretin)
VSISKYFDDNQQEKNMSLENPIGVSASRTNRPSTLLLLTVALCALNALQASAAPVKSIAKARVAAHSAVAPHFEHRSIWAQRWAAAHPQEEADYIARISRHYWWGYHPAVHHARFAYRVLAPKVASEACAQQISPRAVAAQLNATAPQPNNASVPTTAALQTTYPDLVVPAGSTTTYSERQQRAAGTDEDTTGDVSLDFVDADISDVLKALAVQTGSNIVSSTDVKGTITVSLAHVTLEQALDMVARLSGYQYAKVGSTYVVGSASGIAALTGSGDDETPVCSVVPLHYASPDDVTSALKNRFPDIKVSSGTAISGSKAGAKYNAIILMGDASTVAQAHDLVTEIDTSLGASVSQESTSVYRVQYASLPDMVSILASLAPNVVVTPGPSQGFTTKAPSAAAAASSSSASGTSSGGSSGSASGATGASQSNAYGPNLLLLTGAPDDVAKAEAILADVDVQPSQLVFDTKVTEIDRNVINNLGLNWDFSGATTRIGEQADNTAKPPATLGDNGEPGKLLSFGTISRTAISNLATVTMDALISNGDAKLLADPNIAALDGQPAQVFIGNTVNYVQSITQTTTGENITTASVQVGVILRVTGKVNPDGYITLNIHPEVSEITGYLTVPGGGSLPQVASRYADTTVRVKDGETIAIGGLIQENDTVNLDKVPGLGDLPFFGKLFQDSQTNRQRTEVVFFLTTKIASSS